MNRNYLVLNTTVLFLLASVLEMTLHEAGHFTAALLLNGSPVLYHNYVAYRNPEAGSGASILFAAAGPLLSLLLGMVTFIALRTSIRRPFTRLFLWLFSVSAFIGFFGYLMIAPFFSYGDTGYVLRALHCPMWAIMMVAAAGAATLYFVMVGLAPFPISLMREATAGDADRRRKFVRALVVLPLMAGIPLLALLNLPTPTFLSLLAPLMSPWSVMYAYGAYLRGRPSHKGFDPSETVAGRMPAIWFVLLAIIILINRLLVLGFSL